MFGKRHFAPAGKWKLRAAIAQFVCALAIQAGAADLAATSREPQSPARVIIRNTYMIGRQAVSEDVLVSILIVDGKLEVVTQDTIPPNPPELAIDGRGGFLMGKLQLGAPPSFVILDQNPRENFDVFLNTGAHVRFAMRDGVIVRNTLPAAAEVKPAKRGWTAYSPPPVAVPLSYFDGRKWNKFETKYVSGLFNALIAMDRLRWPSQDDASEAQVGPLSNSAVGGIRAIRFGLVGTLNFKRPWVYTFFVATKAFDKGFDSTTSDNFVLYDLRLDIPLPAGLNLSVGKQKEPISMERLMNLVFLPWQERSAVSDSFQPARNLGLVVNGTALRSRASWAVGAFNNWAESGESFADTSSQLVGRLTGVPFLSADKSNLLHLGIGLRYSVTRQGYRAKTEPEFDQAPLFVDTGLFAAQNAFTYDLEAYWRKGPVLLGAEYIGSPVDAPESGDPRFSGYHIGVAWALTGEMRSYRWASGIFNPLPVARPVNQGGWGAWELACRYSDVDLSDGAVDGGRMATASAGLNWWPTQRVHFGMVYRYITLDRIGVRGKSSGFNLRLVLILD